MIIKQSLIAGKEQFLMEKITSINITLGELLDIWIEEDLKPGSMSNGTVELYQNIVKLIKRHPICMDIYTHATRASKRSTARLLDMPFSS